MRLLIAALIAPVLAVSAQAQAQQPFDTQGIANFCTTVSSPLPEMHPAYPRQLYRYEQIVATWAHVQPTDPLPEIDRKIGQFLNANLARLLCNQVNFNPRNGNILKLAVARQSNRFISDILDRWRPNLNQVDAVDGKTVLDYIVDRRAQMGPTSSYGRTLTGYYNRFRAAGARHASELRR